MPSFQASFKDVKIKFPRSTHIRPARSLLGQHNVAFCQEEWAWGIGDPWENHESNQSHGDRKNAVDDEQPAPAGHTSHSGEIGIRRSLQVPANHAT